MKISDVVRLFKDQGFEEESEWVEAHYSDNDSPWDLLESITNQNCWYYLRGLLDGAENAPSN